MSDDIDVIEELKAANVGQSRCPADTGGEING